MSVQHFGFDLFYTNLMKKNIDLVNDTIKVALCADFAPSYSSWSASTSYSAGDIIIPTTRNGRRYRAMNAGTSDSSEPIWSTVSGATITDNDITWEEYGGEHANNEFWDNISVNEVSSGDGYTTGGATLTSQDVSQVTANPNATRLDAGDVSWGGLTKTWRIAVAYVDGDTPGTNDFLISYILFDDTPADVSVTGIDFTIQWSTSGILALTRRTS